MASKEGTTRGARKSEHATTAGRKIRKVEPGKSVEKLPLTGQTKATRSSTNAKQPRKQQTPSSTSPEDCEPTKKRTRRSGKTADVSSSANCSSSKTNVSSSQAPERQPEHNEHPDKPAKKRTRKTFNKKERQALVDHINKVDTLVLSEIVRTKLSEQCLADHLQSFANTLCDDEILLNDILLHHRARFGELYIQCKQEVDPFLQFQLQWHQHCAAFLLDRTYSLTAINLDECAQQSVAEIRMRWLDFCDSSSVPFSDSSKVMMTLSSTVYELLLGRVESFQETLFASVDKPSHPTSNDSDDVYFRFGGAAICEMLKSHYKQIKQCPDPQRDQLSQEITILKAMTMTMKDKISLPLYLKYRDRGFMYFPDSSFVIFIETINDAIRAVMSTNSLEQDIVKVAHEEVKKNADLPIRFKQILAGLLPNMDTFSEDAVNNVYQTFVRKISNTVIQEIISSAKQQMATKKGLASTVDVNLRPVLLAHHAKMETKLGQS